VQTQALGLMLSLRLQQTHKFILPSRRAPAAAVRAPPIPPRSPPFPISLKGFFFFFEGEDVVLEFYYIPLFIVCARMCVKECHTECVKVRGLAGIDSFSIMTILGIKLSSSGFQASAFTP
jgi:hypothetical protein